MSRSRRDLPTGLGSPPATPPEAAPAIPPEILPETPPVAATEAAAAHQSEAVAPAAVGPPPDLLGESPGEPGASVPPPAREGRGAAVWLAATLALIVVLVFVSPFWAPALAPLLPWGGAAGPTAPTAAPGVDGDILARLDRIEAAQRAGRASGPAVAEVKPALDRLDKRLAAIEARPAPPPPDLGDIRRQLATLADNIGELSGRVGAVEKSLRADAAGNPADAALALALLQIREAIELARPFAGEYGVLTGLARSRPEVAKAAELLAEPARTGVASRAVLTRRLGELAGSITEAATPPAADDFGSRIVARLRSLVTIRRVAGPGQTAPEAAVSAAEKAMREGDLAAAVHALDGLHGASAEAAQPWLRMAKARLQVEYALRRVEELLAARLTSAARPTDLPR